jgi:hypothetical protein
MEIVSSASGPGAVEPSTPSSGEFGGGDSQASNQNARPVPASQRNGAPVGDTPQPGQQQGQEPKKESRYERTKRQRAEIQRREMALQQREAQLAQVERERNQPKKPQYTLAELREYRDAWAKEAEEGLIPGREELVKKADAEIRRLEGLEKQQTQSQAFQNEWHQAEAELAQADPEFGANKGTRLDKKLRELMSGPDGNIYRQHPRGIVAAYHRARMEILESDHAVAQKRISELETELKRLTGLTSIGGGSPGRVSANGNRVENIQDFSRLKTADMRKHLRNSANKTESPWF